MYFWFSLQPLEHSHNIRILSNLTVFSYKRIVNFKALDLQFPKFPILEEPIEISNQSTNQRSNNIQYVYITTSR